MAARQPRRPNGGPGMPVSASPARRRAVEALHDIFNRGLRHPAALRVHDRELAPADRDLCRELVLGVLRWRTALDRELAASCRPPLGRLAFPLREILETAVFQMRHLERIPPHAIVHEAVEEARRTAGEGGARLVNAVLRSIQRNGYPPASVAGEAERLAAEYSHPVFLVDRWARRFGADRARRILEADNQRHPLDLLVRVGRTTREGLAARLAEEGVRAVASPVAPLALTVVEGNPLATKAFAEGEFYVADAGGQVLPDLLPPGDTLLDLAAAPGGKSLAAIFSGRFRRSIAMDRSIARIAYLMDNRRRLGTDAVKPLAGDLRAAPLPAGQFDRVLVDAPCSGTGTLRKNPEIRYRLSPASIERLATSQVEMLISACALLAPGGFLLYATCSLEEEENDQVVARVVETLPRIRLGRIAALPPLDAFVEGGRFRITPEQGTDGFTAHLLQRQE
jgi:16S rRNA (cytosine967-C5)-methyltransferase